MTNLPNPLISIDKGLDGERVLLFAEFRDLSSTEPMTTEPMTPGQIRKVIEHIDYIRKFESDRIKLTTRQWINVRAKDEKRLKAARTRLAETGLDSAKLEKFPADQIILLDEVREFEERRDDAAKFAKLPTWLYEQFFPMVVQAKEPALLELFIVSNRKVRLAQGRLEQRIALLRHVEAIRMYAAENGRKLPATLDDIKLPLPVDPFTGKPFRYSFEKDTAHLRGTPPAMPARPRQPDPDEEDDESFEYDADNYDPDDPETYPQGLYDDDGPRWCRVGDAGKRCLKTRICARIAAPTNPRKRPIRSRASVQESSS